MTAPYEELARLRKAARIAVAIARHSPEKGVTADFDVATWRTMLASSTLRASSLARAGVERASEETWDEVARLLAADDQEAT